MPLPLDLRTGPVDVFAQCDVAKRDAEERVGRSRSVAAEQDDSDDQTAPSRESA
jgi:hypothetical protein